MDGCGSNKLCTHLQHDHKNDKVDSSMAVISDLKQITSKETMLPTQGVFNENHSIIREYSLFIFTKKGENITNCQFKAQFPLTQVQAMFYIADSEAQYFFRLILCACDFAPHSIKVQCIKL